MKRHRATVRGGRKRTFKTEGAYRLHLRSMTEEVDATKSAAKRDLWYGSKIYKTELERRPKRGGKVHS